MQDIVNKIKEFFKKLRSSKFIVIPVVLIFALLLYKYKGVFVAASVNGQPISRLSVLSQLEKEGGKQVLDNLITNNLILQEANKEKVTVTSSEISNEIGKIQTQLKSSGSDLDTALLAQGMTRKDLEDQIRLKIMVDKMAAKDVNVADKDVEDYFNKNKSSYPKETKLDSVKDEIKKMLVQQKTAEAVSNWISNLKTKAKINYFVSY